MPTFEELEADNIVRQDANPYAPIDKDVLFGKSVITLRFRHIEDPRIWAAAQTANPEREGQALDARDHFNIDGAAWDAVHEGAFYLDGETEVSWTREQWDIVLPALSATDFNKVRDAMWNLNQMQPVFRILEAKKALAAASTVKPASLENSESASAGSPAGNRASRRATSTPKATPPATRSPRKNQSGTPPKSAT